jgi:hypothetical protein
MTVTTFRSNYGSWNVTRAVLACEPEISKEGTTTQKVVIFETTDQQEAVSITGKTFSYWPMVTSFNPATTVSAAHPLSLALASNTQAH